ncbi:MAG: PHP domain-containing protein [Anaerolineaceae bacterium]|nr:PHP domain-containing protein [Anaerolineaceae bacterium]
MGLADLHIHTVHSWDGTSTVSAVLKYAADFTNLDVIAITDHDCIEGALDAVHLAPRYGVEVIPGCEISTSDGQLLALFIQKPIPVRRSLKETLNRVGEQGGICIAAHPGGRTKSSISLQLLRQILQDPDARAVLVGIESFTARPRYNARDRQVDELAKELKLARVGSSDSHVLDTIGSRASEFTGFLAEDLRRALMRGAIRAHIGRSSGGVEKITSWVPQFLMRKMGWVTTNHSPYGPLYLGRMIPTRR